jgi:hypothetical protein
VNVHMHRKRYKYELLVCPLYSLLLTSTAAMAGLKARPSCPVSILAFALEVALSCPTMLGSVRVPCEPEAVSHVRVWEQEDERVLVATSRASADATWCRAMRR